MLKILDIFSGIGGFSLGLERTGGFKAEAFCEIDPFSRKVLTKHWPGIPIYEDVNALSIDSAETETLGPDVICGGFPCQDISNAGLRLGLKGSRSGLWQQFARLIGEFRPRYAIVENVAAINFRGLETVLGDLTALGYDSEWHIIPAWTIGAPHERARCWTIGAPHERARCWIIAHATSEPWIYQSDIAKAATRLLNDTPPWRACPWQTPEAGVCGVDDGIPDRVDRTAHLGNAVVPQIVEIIGRAILAAESS